MAHRSVTFFFDNDCTPAFAKILGTLGEPVKHMRTATETKGLVTDDVKWISRIGELGGIALTCNRRILTVPAERNAMIKSGCRVVFYEGWFAHIDLWQWAKWHVTNWPRLAEAALHLPKGHGLIVGHRPILFTTINPATMTDDELMAVAFPKVSRVTPKPIGSPVNANRPRTQRDPVLPGLE